MRTLIIAICMVAISVGNVFATHTAKITIKVMDEENMPIGGAKVTVGFTRVAPGGIGAAEKHKRGLTDNDGKFTESNVTMSTIGFSVDKEGYYQSGAGYEFKSSSLLLNRWEPWNPTINVVLKKKRNPVAMYIKGTDNLKAPVFDKPIGYDLEKGDLVAPYGSGSVSDFVFTFHSNDRAYSDYECDFTLTFSNEHDGIQEYLFDSKNQSLYKWPFVAPESGYLSKLYKEKSMIPGKGYKSNEKNNAHYLFRVRTKVNKDGKIIGGLYGKIEKEFEFDPKGSIFFGYYLNPDGTRNLEEDPARNLFKKK